MTTEKNIHILIADDHPIFRQGLKQVLENQLHKNSIIDEADDGERALEYIEDGNFDLIILDINMPEKNGIEVVRTMNNRGISCPVIFLTMYDDKELFEEAIEIGVKGYVLKENAVHDIIEAVNSILKGKPYISALMSPLILQDKSINNKNIPSLSSLTMIEKRILRYIADGKTSKQIGEELHLSSKTIDNHRNNISSKLNIKGTHSLLKFAVQHKSEL